MAHKKKAQRVTSTNNKKGGKANKQARHKQSGRCTVFDATKAAQAAVAQGVLHPDDPTVEFCKYLATGKRLDSKTLVKKLPQTTQLMMMPAGSTTTSRSSHDTKGSNTNQNTQGLPRILPQDFAKVLSTLVYDVQFAARQQQMTRDNVSDHIRSVVLHVARGLGQRALKREDNVDLLSSPEARDFLHDYAERCYQRSQVVDPATAGPWQHIQFYQLAMDEVCEKYAPQFDKLLQPSRRSGSTVTSRNTNNNSSKSLQTTTSLFLKTCPLYQKNLLVYSALAEKLFDETTQGKMMDSQATLQDQKRHLALAAQGVTKGLHDVKRTCWECGAVHTTSIQCCTLCHVANYCGRDCQVKAWRSGHQQKCKTLATAYAHFQESLQAIEDKHQVIPGDDFDNDQSDATQENDHHNPASLSASSSTGNDPCSASQCFDEDSDYAIFQAMVGGSQQLEVPLSHTSSPEDDEDDDAIPNLEVEEDTPLNTTTTATERPSMTMFYNNMEKVQNGDLWLFPSDTKNATNELGAYAQELMERGNNMSATSLESTVTMGGNGMDAVQEDEYAYFLQLARFLCFDVVNLAGEVVTGGLSGEEKENETPMQRVMCLGRMFHLAEIYFDGLIMPKERFLELYHKQTPSADKTKKRSAKEEKAARLDQQRMRRMRKGYATRDFMDAFHK